MLPGSGSIEVICGSMFSGKSEELIRRAVKGMLPKNKLGSRLFRKLKVYAGSGHPHQAQNPKPLNI